MQQVNQASLEATLNTLKLVGAFVGLMAILGPVLISALLWKFFKEFSERFASKQEVNGLGGRVTAYETFAIQTRDKADSAHERLDKLSSALKTELRYIRRDISRLLHMPPVEDPDDDEEEL